MIHASTISATNMLCVFVIQEDLTVTRVSAMKDMWEMDSVVKNLFL
jgi:hypothetical protein